jgi:pSer/pThr/pTyr-binding forkhead associated (FHA) protein
VVNDDAVSKEHAWVVPVDDGMVVIDRGSTNGTFVNSINSPKVGKVHLQNGDKIFIGKGVATLVYNELRSWFPLLFSGESGWAKSGYIIYQLVRREPLS